MRAVDRALAFICAVTAVFALSFTIGRLVGPIDEDEPPPAPAQEHHGDH